MEAFDIDKNKAARDDVCREGACTRAQATLQCAMPGEAGVAMSWCRVGLTGYRQTNNEPRVSE